MNPIAMQACCHGKTGKILRLCAFRDCVYSAPCYKSCEECEALHEHDGHEVTYRFDKVADIVRKVDEKIIDTTTHKTVKDRNQEIQRCCQGFASLYNEDKLEIEKNLITSQQLARTMELLNHGSLDLKGSDIFELSEAVSSGNKLYQNEEQVREALQKLEEIYNDHYTQIIKVLENLSEERKRFKESEYKKLKTTTKPLAKQGIRTTNAVTPQPTNPQIIESRRPRYCTVSQKSDEELQQISTGTDSEEDKVLNRNRPYSWQAVVPSSNTAAPQRIVPNKIIFTAVKDIRPEQGLIVNLKVGAQFWDQKMLGDTKKSYFRLYDSTGYVKGMFYELENTEVVKEGANLMLVGMKVKMTKKGTILVHPTMHSQITAISEEIVENKAAQDISMIRWPVADSEETPVVVNNGRWRE